MRLYSTPALAILCTLARAQELPPIHLGDETWGIHDRDLLSPDFHRGRREALRDSLPPGSVAVFFANPVRNRSNDVDYEYHQDPDLYYLTGLTEPNAVLFIFKDPVAVKGELTNELLVVQDRDPKREVWTGQRLGADGAKAVLRIKSTLSGKDFMDVKLPASALHRRFVSLHDENLANDPHDRADLADLVDHVSAGLKEVPDGLQGQLGDWMAGLRQVKLDEELTLMRKAIDITCEAQIALMRSLKPGMTEYQTEAVVQYVFTARGAEHEGYPSILGSGQHSCVLHYVTNRRTLADGDLLVSDVGAEYHGYTADVTRTLPSNGRFSPEQKAIYELVFRAQAAGIAAVRPGAPFHAAHLAATEVITKGLMDLGLIKEKSEVRRYFMHGTSHYLGLDVHDAGRYGPLTPGNVITVEPGIYIAEGSPCDPKWWNIGVRIEDDVLITREGNEVLSDCLPSTVAEIERIMAEPWDGVLPGLK